jgi:tRNA 2-thiouridine synthesizing protein D
MMKFGILIQEGPYHHQASDSAYHFIKAAMDKGHEIVGVFFYSDGVLNATKHMEPPQDDRHISKRWSELGKQGVDIIVCVAAGKRRGIVEGEIVGNIRISGLGQLTDMCINADRIITFGD